MSSRDRAKVVLDLPVALYEQIAIRAKASNCKSVSDFVARMYVEKVENEEQKRLEQLLREGLKGPAIPVNDELWQKLRRNVRKKVARMNGDGHRTKDRRR